MQEVKVTLSAQLKETKQMVSDASITAQNASRFILIFLHFVKYGLLSSTCKPMELDIALSQ